jgi:hypothetical protein
MLLTHAVLVAVLLSAGSADPGEDLVRRINAAHRPTWFTSLIFVQRTTWPGGNRPEETWYETMVRPGQLRIDIDRGGQPMGGMIFRSDSIYQFTTAGTRPARSLVHPLLVLLHDIHVDSADTVVVKLRGLGFDLGKTRTGSWQGKPVTVVGASAGDTTSAQFWIDDADMVVVRIIQPGPNGAVNDTRMTKFSREPTGLVEREIQFYNNGRLNMVEEYTWVRTGVKIDPTTFDPDNRQRPSWIFEYLKVAK